MNELNDALWFFGLTYFELLFPSRLKSLFKIAEWNDVDTYDEIKMRKKSGCHWWRQTMKSRLGDIKRHDNVFITVCSC